MRRLQAGCIRAQGTAGGSKPAQAACAGAGRSCAAAGGGGRGSAPPLCEEASRPVRRRGRPGCCLALRGGASPLGKDLMPSDTSTAPSAQMGVPSALNTGRRPLGQQRCTKWGRGRPTCRAGRPATEGLDAPAGALGGGKAPGVGRGRGLKARYCRAREVFGVVQKGGKVHVAPVQARQAGLPAPSGVLPPPSSAPLTLTLIQFVSSPVAATHDTASRQAWCASARLMRPAAQQARKTASGEKTATQGTAQAGTWLGFSGKLYRQYCRRGATQGAELGTPPGPSGRH